MTGIAVSDSPGRGRGVFATRRFAAGETIEVCPVIVLTESDARALDHTGLFHYYFGWGNDGQAAAIGLGYSSLYNHADSPNATHMKNLADQTITITALRPIAAGDEILIRYDPGPSAPDGAVWFEVR